ncbi:MAG: hypothetical protein H7124_10720 [Phycisphaerales bacterium]|nr:hypothetical protein [Hyphomonadaceae bacterium]
MNADFRAVRKILWEDWDPIGCGVPQDEYDYYAGPALRLLIEKAPPADVADYLRQTAADTIGCPVDEEKLARVVAKLMALQEGETPI